MSVTVKRDRKHFGTIRQMSSGRFQVRFTDTDGKRRPAPRTFLDRKQAEIWLARKRVEIEDRIWSPPKPDDKTVVEWAERWLVGAHIRESTRRGYLWLTRIVTEKWGDTPVSEIKKADLQAWLGEMTSQGRSRATIRHIAGTMRRILTYAVEIGGLESNPAERLHIASARPSEVKPLTIAQIEDLAEAISHSDLHVGGNGATSTGRAERPDLALAVKLAAYCGLRAGEVWGLRRRDIQLESSALIIEQSVTAGVTGKLVIGPTKSGRGRRVPIPRQMISELQKHLKHEVKTDPDALVFTSNAGTPVNHGTFFKRYFRPALIRAGLSPETRFHDLRHSYASLLIAAGGHSKAIQERLGHSSITVTLNTYGHLFPSLDEALTERLEKAIAGHNPDFEGTIRAQMKRREKKEE